MELLEALNWWSNETRSAGGASLQLPLLAHITVCIGQRQTRSPGDTAVCLLIISGQDEPSGAATGDRLLSAGVCMRESKRLSVCKLLHMLFGGEISLQTYYKSFKVGL